MTEHNNDESIKNKNKKEKVATIIGVTFLFMIVAAFVLGLTFFGFAGIFELLGVRYQSIWSFVIFVVSFFILGSVVDLFSDAIRSLSIQKTRGYMDALLIQVLIAFLANLFVLMTVDALMDSITLSLEVVAIVAFLLALLDAVFDNKKENK